MQDLCLCTQPHSATVKPGQAKPQDYINEFIIRKLNLLVVPFFHIFEKISEKIFSCWYLVSRDLILKSGARYLRQKIINLADQSEFDWATVLKSTWVTIWLITRLMPQK